MKVIADGTYSPMSGPLDEFLFLDEVARRARVSVESVRYWIKSGRLPSCRPGKRRMVLRRDLEAFLARNKTGTGAGARSR